MALHGPRVNGQVARLGIGASNVAAPSRGWQADDATRPMPTPRAWRTRATNFIGLSVLSATARSLTAHATPGARWRRVEDTVRLPARPSRPPGTQRRHLGAVLALAAATRAACRPTEDKLGPPLRGHETFGSFRATRNRSGGAAVVSRQGRANDSCCSLGPAQTTSLGAGRPSTERLRSLGCRGAETALGRRPRRTWGSRVELGNSSALR
mmetsp:Transcript_64428/g.179181  ORF Transcript_64428/g.179181 Transcript_64428/m.179181 type:complete len:210 (+) Transcript_64428:352-981(+)